MMEKIDILAIGVHPDDVELCCSGTLLKHIGMGYTVGICDLTQGELGTRGNGPLRLMEAEDSRQLLGAKFRLNLKMRDGFAEINEKNLLSIIEVIRACKPKMVLANALSDRHPDHGRAGKMISRACFLSGLRKIETKSEEGSQEAFRPQMVLHYIQDRHIEPDILVDISDYIEQKEKAILCFKSQFFQSDLNEPETPISSKAFLDYVKARDLSYGRQINALAAEGFTSEKYLGVDDLFKLR